MRKLQLILAALVLPGVMLRAQLLSRDEAVRIALKNSLGIDLGRNAVKIAEINNSYGIAGGLPLVTGTASDQEQSTSIRQKYSDPTDNKQSDNAFSNSLTGAVNGYILMYNGARVVNAKKQLGELEAQSRQQLSSKALIVVNNVLLKYYDVVRQQSYAKTLQASIDAQKQQLSIVQAQQSVGLANNSDLFQSEVDLNTQIQNLQAQQLIIDQDKTDMLALLTLNPDSVIQVEDTILIDRTIQLPGILSALQGTNPDIIAANEQIVINQYVEKQVAAQRYPSLGDRKSVV